MAFVRAFRDEGSPFFFRFFFSFLGRFAFGHQKPVLRPLGWKSFLRDGCEVNSGVEEPWMLDYGDCSLRI